jgi:hypothetical protein|tara:strand:+ start:163 stop:933 length:771 start_codon:yes stop_codon:yes gene_type:complete
MKWVLKNFVLLTIIILIAVWAKPVLADSTNDDNDQTNSSGSNTQITGGYTSTTTNNNDGQTNTTTSTTTNNSTTNGSDIPVNSANSPSFSSMSQDVCSMGLSGSVSTLGFGASVGKHVRDLNCERIKLSKVLYDYGMKVAAVSILCQDERVFEAMQMAGTPCPFEGKIGKEALEQWNKYDIERPDYDSYVSKLENRSRVDEELAEIERQQEAERVAEEKARKKAELETLKAQEEVDNIIIETDLHTEEVRIINIHE